MGENRSYDISTLYGRYGGDIYIVGSGATLNYIDKSFFWNKTVIALNNAYLHFDSSFVFTHHHEIAQAVIDSGNRLVVSKHHICHSAHPVHDFKGVYYYYYHIEQGFCDLNLDEFGGDVLCVAGTPVVGAMNLAYKLGADSIILCGVDGGLIDGVYNYDGYPTPTQQGHTQRVGSAVLKMANRIREEGVGVYSINPFINLGMEGHTWSE